MEAGALSHGETAGREATARFGGVVASTAALAALPADARRDGMVMLVDTASPKLWQFDAASEASAGASVVEPSVGDGRWLLLTGTVKQRVVAGQAEAGDDTIPVTGIAAGDVLVSVIVFDTGVPSARALTDFTVSADTLTVVANAADNTGNQYLITWQ